MPTTPPRAARHGEGGFALVVVVSGIAVMLILMGAAVPTWRYVMKDDREQELFFRGDQIARGIEAFQKKNGNAFPPSLEVLVKGKYLRKAYKDPLAADGKWRIIRPGEAVPASGIPRTGPGSASPSPSPRPSATPPPSVFGSAGGIGVIAGVASRSTDESLRVFNGRTKYDQWIFLAGQPRVLGKNKGPVVPGLGQPGQPLPGQPRPGQPRPGQQQPQRPFGGGPTRN
jgi:type II secretory pathway pseudopilin PulG